jgi:hypothetical protein
VVLFELVSKNDMKIYNSVLFNSKTVFLSIPFNKEFVLILILKEKRNSEF